jgi:rhamnose transport system permease protein
LRRELAPAFALAALLAAVAMIAPSFFHTSNLADVGVNNLPLLVAAVGMTLVILTGNIDISIGSQFAICSVVAGLLAKAGAPMIAVAFGTALVGAVFGALNGFLVARAKIPSIVVTLASMIMLRAGLQWATEGSWVRDLPRQFQWLGLGQMRGALVLAVVSLAVFAAFAWALRNLVAGRQLYATGSNLEGARLVGIRTENVVWSTFVLMGALTGVAALLNTLRFTEVQANGGVGLELKAIAAVVVGGAAITGGRGTLWGTLAGVALLGVIGTALAFLGVNPAWEKAIQGAIILAAVAANRNA